MVEGGTKSSNIRGKRPKLSIITVLFNAAHLLPEFFENVMRYLNSEVELIILDGCSTDCTIEILQKNNHLISYWCSQPDDGIYDAMNKATKYASGKWLYYMGADDRLLGGFKNAVAQLSNPDTVYYGKVVVWGEVWDKPFKKYDLTKIAICHQSVFYPAEVFKYHQYDGKYPVYADQHLNLACYADSRFKWQFIDELMAIYDTRGYTANLKDEAHKRDHAMAIKKHLGLWVYIRYRFRLFKQARKGWVPSNA